MVMERALESVRAKTGESEAQTMKDVRAFATECSRSKFFRMASSSSLKESESATKEFRRENQQVEEASAYLSRSEDLAE